MSTFYLSTLHLLSTNLLYPVFLPFFCSTLSFLYIFSTYLICPLFLLHLCSILSFLFFCIPLFSLFYCLSCLPCVYFLFISFIIFGSFSMSQIPFFRPLRESGSLHSVPSLCVSPFISSFSVPFILLSRSAFLFTPFTSAFVASLKSLSHTTLHAQISAFSFLCFLLLASSLTFQSPSCLFVFSPSLPLYFSAPAHYLPAFPVKLHPQIRERKEMKRGERGI